MHRVNHFDNSQFQTIGDLHVFGKKQLGKRLERTYCVQLVHKEIIYDFIELHTHHLVISVLLVLKNVFQHFFLNGLGIGRKVFRRAVDPGVPDPAEFLAQVLVDLIDYLNKVRE